MGKLKPQTFIFGGEGVLVLPDGKEVRINSMTLTYPDTMDIIEDDRVVHQSPGRGPIRITFEEVEDGKSK